MDWLPGARAAVLGRLWGALAREPIPGVTGRTAAADTLTVHFGRRTVTGDRHATQPFATPPAGFAVALDGTRYDDPGALMRALAPANATRFAAELDDSVANLALARAAQPAPDGGPPAIGRPTPHPAHWEQLVVDGHPLHPGCRTRLGMSAADMRRYAPEHRPVVDLVTVPVPPERWLTTGAGLPPELTLHPWQAARLGVRGHIRPARPLMSLRTLAPLDDPRHHVKTAIDAQLTSAVRTVSEAAVRNGPPVTAFLAGVQDGITILREPAAGIVLDSENDDRPDRRRAMVHRQAPPPGAIPLAALAAPSPADGRPLAREVVAAGYAGDPAAYLADLGRLLRRALDLAERGIGLEAHGQNLLVTLDRGRPHRLYYRDVGGIRIHARTAEEHGLTLYGDLGTEDPDEPATTVRAAVGVVVGEQVAALARETGAEPEALWRAALPHADRAPWPVKATTAMRLADDPLRPIWAVLR